MVKLIFAKTSTRFVIASIAFVDMNAVLQGNIQPVLFFVVGVMAVLYLADRGIGIRGAGNGEYDQAIAALQKIIPFAILGCSVYYVVSAFLHTELLTLLGGICGFAYFYFNRKGM